MSIVTLSVSIWARTSSSSTASPGFLRMAAIWPSLRLGWGGDGAGAEVRGGDEGRVRNRHVCGLQSLYSGLIE